MRLSCLTLIVTLAGVFAPACSRKPETAGRYPEQHDQMCWYRIETGEAPPARLDHAMAVDQDGREIYLWGGRGAHKLFKDLWVYNSQKRAWREIETETAPPARSGHSLVFDQAADRFILFGGFSYNSSGEVRFHSDLWFYSFEDGWNREFFGTGPAGRAWHSALVAQDSMVVFGGFGEPPHYYLQDVWSLDFKELAFRRIATDGGPLMAGSPVLLDMGGPTSLLAYGPSALHVFGREGTTDPARTGLWSLQVELDLWSLVETGNPPDHDFTLTARGADGKTLLVGRGPDEDDEDREWNIWTITAGDEAWRDFDAAGGPVTAHRMACASEPGRPGSWICFGGARHGQLGAETWSLSPCEGPGEE
jgi:hypothetical protein